MNEQTRPDPANGRTVALPDARPNGATFTPGPGHAVDVPQSISVGREGVPMTTTDPRGTRRTAPDHAGTAVPSTDLDVPQRAAGRTTVAVPQPDTATRTAGTATQVKPGYRARLRTWGRHRDGGRTADVPEVPNLTTAEGRAAHTARIMHIPDRIIKGFYVAVLIIALIGQTQAAAKWLHWILIAAAAAVATVELGGAGLLAYADARRQLKERAYVSLALSAGVAVFATAVNWEGHLNSTGHPTVAAYFFAGMSALGYLVFLIRMQAKRRDRLRITSDIAEAPPSYEIALWLQHPIITSRARNIAKRRADLGKFGSWDAAKKAIQDEKRDARLARELELLLVEKAVTPRLAKIATAIYEPDEIVSRLLASADYDGLAAILSGKLSASKVLDEAGGGRTAKKPPVPVPPVPPRQGDVPQSDTAAAAPRTTPPVPQSDTSEVRGTSKPRTADTAPRGATATAKGAEVGTAKGDDEVYLAAVREEHPTGLVSRGEVVAVLRKHFPDLGPSQSRPGRVRDKLNAERGFHEQATG